MNRQFNVPSEKTLKPQLKSTIQGSPKARSKLDSQSQKPSEYLTSITAASKIYLSKAEPYASPPRSFSKTKGPATHITSKSSFPDYSTLKIPDISPISNIDKHELSRNEYMDTRDIPKTSEPMETGFQKIEKDNFAL